MDKINASFIQIALQRDVGCFFRRSLFESTQFDQFINHMRIGNNGSYFFPDHVKHHITDIILETHFSGYAVQLGFQFWIVVEITGYGPCHLRYCGTCFGSASSAVFCEPFQLLNGQRALRHKMV